MKYFTVGPIQMYPAVCAAGGVQIPYFRDDVFAQKTKWMQNAILKMAKATTGSKVAMLSGCGTTAMEASVLNFTCRGDEVVVINGGSFGQRFVDICGSLGRVVHDLKPPLGECADLDALAVLLQSPIKAVFVTAHETSTGQKINIQKIGAMCREAGVLLVCDAVSAIGADPFEMAAWGVNVCIFSSNKGLGLAPGIGFVIADEIALQRISCDESYVLSLEKYFQGAERGQPPYTPPVGVLIQLEAQIKRIEGSGGIDQVVAKVQENAFAFRESLSKIGITSFPKDPSNAITAFVLERGSSSELYEFLRDEYGLLINMTAYGLGVDLPRVSHLGDLTVADHELLADGIQTYLQGKTT